MKCEQVNTDAHIDSATHAQCLLKKLTYLCELFPLPCPSKMKSKGSKSQEIMNPSFTTLKAWPWNSRPILYPGRAI